MDFFEHQARARKQTTRLIALFALAVLAVVACTTIAVWGAIALANPATDAALSATDTGIQRPFDANTLAKNPKLLIGIATATLLLVIAGSLFKIMQLGSGDGSAIAERLGGKPLSHDSADPDEQRLLNIVEEMAIASGTPVPPVYLLEDEAAINAFAAGTTVENAAIGVTRGTVRYLSRDELQGVIGHEFSHILSGDMKINLRLIGVLAGILVIGHLGTLMMRSAWYVAAAGGSRRSRDKGGSGALFIWALGGALMAIGFVGAFFGSWIKSAVSRQREFLADASAVQFTRNRNGIADALKKIGGFKRRSLLKTPAADECSHMYFGKGVNSIFATHPPLTKRILALDPSWDGSFTKVEETPPPETIKAAEKIKVKIAADSFAHAVTLSAAAMIGQPTNDHLAYAATLYSAIPEKLRTMAGDPYSARAIIAAMLVSHFPETQQQQLEIIQRLADAGFMKELRAAAPLVGKIDPSLRLPLIELTAPSLHRLSPKQVQSFITLTDALINADGKTDLFEWCVHRIAITPLNQKKPWSPTHIYSSKGVEHEAEKLLGWLAIAGHSGLNNANQAYALGAEHFGIDARLMPKSDLTTDEIDQAVTQLHRASAKVKKQLIEACAVVVSFDKEVTPQEAELFRAISSAMGVPVPPVLPGQQLI